MDGWMDRMIFCYLDGQNDILLFKQIDRKQINMKIDRKQIDINIARQLDSWIDRHENR